MIESKWGNLLERLDKIDKLLNALSVNLESTDFMSQYGLHESNVKYAFCSALEKAGIRSFKTEVLLPIYPQAPHLRGIEGKREVRVDLAVEVDDILIGFEFKTDSLSRISGDDITAYINNLSCLFFTTLKPGDYSSPYYGDYGRPDNFWLYEFERFSNISGIFGLLTFEPIAGSLSILSKPIGVKKASQRLHNFTSSEEDKLKYEVWKSLKKEGYRVISEPTPKHVEYENSIMMIAPQRRKYISISFRRVPKIKRMDLISVKGGETIGVEVKASLKGLRDIAGQLERYLRIYDLDTLYLAVPIKFAGKARSLISTHPSLYNRVQVMAIIGEEKVFGPKRSQSSLREKI
jgi:hypothetical protein